MSIELGGFIVAALVAIIGILEHRRLRGLADKAEERAIKAEKATEEAINRERLNTLYGGFELANQATMEFPELLRSIHGVTKLEAKDSEELRNIVYLSILMDTFQKSTECTNGKYNFEIIGNHSFLNKICSSKENLNRWNILKRIYYGEIDMEFILFVDKIFSNEEKNITKP